MLSLKNSLRQKGIPETIKLGNKNNNQAINALLKIHSPKALHVITLNAQINPLFRGSTIGLAGCGIGLFFVVILGMRAENRSGMQEF